MSMHVPVSVLITSDYIWFSSICNTVSVYQFLCDCLSPLPSLLVFVFLFLVLFLNSTCIVLCVGGKVGLVNERLGALEGLVGE
jgi:hypothetical protein